MAEDYAQGRSMKHRMIIPASEEDCPNRAEFLRDLELRRGWEPSNWRAVLGVKANPDLGQNVGQK